MGKNKLVQLLLIGCAILSLLTGCFSTKQGPTSSTLAAGVTLTPTTAPTLTATPAPTLVPTLTITPTPMPAPVTSLVPVGASLRISKGPLGFTDLSPDGKTLLVGSQITVCAYQIADGKEIWCRTTGAVDGSTLRGLAYSPDGKTFLTGLENGLLILWDSASGNPLWAIPNIKLNTAAWSPDNLRIVLSSQDLFLRVLDARNGNLAATIQLNGIPPTVLRWSPDGKTIASGDDTGAITRWDPQTGKVLSTRHYFPDGQLVTSLVWTPDSKMILAGSSSVSSSSDCIPGGSGFTSCSYDGNVTLFDAATGAIKWQVDAKYQVHGLALSPDGSTVLARVGDYIGNLYDVNDGKLIQSIITYRALGAFWQPDGNGLYAIDWSGDLFALSLSGQQLAKTPIEGYYDLVDFAWSPDSSQLAASSSGGPVMIWDTASGKLLRTFPIAETGPIAWSKDGKSISVFSRPVFGNPYVSILDAQTGDQEQKLNVIGQVGDVLAWSPDGSLLAVLSHDASTDGAWFSSIVIWDTNTWKVFQIIPTHDYLSKNRLVDIAWTPDGKTLAGVGGIYQWDIATGEQIANGPMNVFSSLSLSPDGIHFVTNNGYILKLQNRLGGFMLSTTSNRGPVTSAAFSPDGKYLASGGDAIVLHSPEDGKILVTLDGYADQPEKLEFSPDSKMIASLSKEDGTIILWKVP